MHTRVTKADARQCRREAHRRAGLFVLGFGHRVHQEFPAQTNRFEAADVAMGISPLIGRSELRVFCLRPTGVGNRGITFDGMGEDVETGRGAHQRRQAGSEFRVDDGEGRFEELRRNSRLEVARYQIEYGDPSGFAAGARRGWAGDVRHERAGDRFSLTDGSG